MGMSKYTRFKLKAHDRGEDRHNKGVSLLKKQSRLDREHQAALEMSKRQRAARIKAQREAAKVKAQRVLKRQEQARRQGALIALEEMAHNLFEAASTDQQRLAPRQYPIKMKIKRVPVTADRTYRIRRLDEVAEVQVTVKSVMPIRPM